MFALSPKRESVAWARPLLLPEWVLPAWARPGAGCYYFLTYLMLVTWLAGLLYLNMKGVNMRVLCKLCAVINELGIMYVWIVGYLYIYWHEVGMHRDSMIGWRNMDKVWIGRNPMTLIVGAQGGASFNGRNPMNPPSESSWWCLI